MMPLNHEQCAERFERLRALAIAADSIAKPS
jgi:hypothetical protein